MRVGGQSGGDAGMEVEAGAFDVEVVLEVEALTLLLVPGEAGVSILTLLGDHSVLFLVVGKVLQACQVGCVTCGMRSKST